MLHDRHYVLDVNSFLCSETNLVNSIDSILFFSPTPRNAVNMYDVRRQFILCMRPYGGGGYLLYIQYDHLMNLNSNKCAENRVFA